jgi:hypothetical protein
MPALPFSVRRGLDKRPLEQAQLVEIAVHTLDDIDLMLCQLLRAWRGCAAGSRTIGCHGGGFCSAPLRVVLTQSTSSAQAPLHAAIVRPHHAISGNRAVACGHSEAWR